MKGILQKIDKYIIFKFLGTYFFAILLIIGISVVFDITQKIDDFIEKAAPLHAIIVDYYFNFIPYYANLFSPLFVFIAVIFFTSKMASQSEIIAILSSGVSFKRLMFPYFVGALIIASFSFYLGSYVIPPANKTRLLFEDTYIKNKRKTGLDDVHLELKSGLFVYMGHYYSIRNRGSNFGAESYDGKVLKSKLTAQSITYNKDKNNWTLSDYVIQNFKKDNTVKIIEGEKKDTVFDMLPSDFKSERKWFQTMDNTELLAYINTQTRKGVGAIQPFQTEYYKRWAYPFSAFILTLIGVSLASRKVRGGMGLHIGVGLGLSFGYILFMTISETFAINGGLNPFVAIWIPNIIFSIIGIVLYSKAPK